MSYETQIINTSEIGAKIMTLRGRHVLLDRDLAMLYGVETRRINEQVKRNISRFPEDFMFQLTKEEAQSLLSQGEVNIPGISSKSQNATLNSKRGQNIKYLPYAFTEQGVAMLSGVLRSATAIEVNIRIMRAFVAMRHFLMDNSHIFQRIENIEHRQMLTDIKVNDILSKLDDGTSSVIEGIFYEGQVFDARVFVEDLIKSAKQEIVLIDAYVDASILKLLTLRTEGVSAKIYTEQIKQALHDALVLHNTQYANAPIELNTYNSNFHDRFLLIDDIVYHIGASIKDLGKRLFGFQKMTIPKSIILNQL